MSNSLENKVQALGDILSRYRLCKSAEEIEHKELTEQNNLGEEMQQEVEGREDGANYASNPADVSAPAEEVRQEPCVQDLSATAEEALKASGTAVVDVPQEKSASYKARLQGIFSELRKQASTKEQDMIYTGTTAFNKIASARTQAEVADASAYFEKLASCNPAFAVAREVAGMYKRAEDIEALADATGIAPEEAAAALDAAVAQDPEAAAELEDEVNGQAIADLAEAEQSTAELVDGIDQMAANASEQLGVEITPDDIVAAAEEVVNQAEAAGVEPEELIAAAVEEMTGEAPVAMDDVSEEDLAAAQEILDDAAANGVSPDEVIQVAAEALADDGEAAGCAEGECEAPAEDVTTEKVAALQKLAGTKRGRLLLGL